MSLAKIDLFQNIPFAEGLAYVKFQNNNYCNKKWGWGGGWGEKGRGKDLSH